MKRRKAHHILHDSTINLGKSVRNVDQATPEAAEGEAEGRIPEGRNREFVASC